MKKKLSIVAIVVVFALAGGLGYFFLHREARAGMELVRLLPPGLDVYFAADLRGLETNFAIRKLAANPPDVPHDPEYERFIRESGFRYERDLRQIAIGKSGKDWVGAARVDLDRPRVTRYLDSEGAQKKDVSGKTIYTFGRARPFRLMFLGEKSKSALVAFTVGGDEAQLLDVIGRVPGVFARAAYQGDSAASELERERGFEHISAGSKVWIVARPEKLWTTGEAQVGSLGISTGLLRGSRMLYASIEPGLTQLSFRVTDVCDSAESARRIANSLRGLLALVRAAPSGKPNTTAQSRSLLDGISVEDVRETVVLRWQWDESALAMLQSSTQ
ncbi:MAG: hypothetical protein HYX72_13265 [Acidobacteria bacterium]|nr:hypothetical protein [Acidobacteriota bacterium]